MAHALRYYKNIIHEDGKVIRIEFHEKDGTAPAMELGSVIQVLNLEIQGGEDVDAPIVKTQLNFTLLDAPDHPDADTMKYGAWEEFYSPDATKWMVVIRGWNKGESPRALWGGYITPDSFHEILSYRSGVSFIARDNIGHLQDFPFDGEGNSAGMITLRNLIDSAWAKIESPMILLASEIQTPDWLQTEGTNALNTYMNVSAFEDKNWYEVLESVLYAYGLVMRYTGDNKVYVYPLRSMPFYGKDSVGIVNPVFLAGAERELTPAAKRIEETAEYDIEENQSQPLVDNNKDFTMSFTKINFTKYDIAWSVEYWKLNKTEDGQGWINNTSLPSYFNPLIYDHDNSVNQDDLSYLWFACTPEYYDVADDGRAIEYSKYVEGGNPISMGISFGIEHLLNNNTLSRFRTNYPRKIRCYVSVVQHGIKKYLTSEGAWDTTKSAVEVSSADGNFALNIPADEFDGTILLSVKIVKILQSSTIAVIYTPIYSFTLSSPNVPLLTVNRVNTKYNERNNLIFSRSPKIAPAMDKPFMTGIIKNGIFRKEGTSYLPTKLWSWDGKNAQQMAVYNHLQLLCYYAKPNNVISGTILNASVIDFAKLYRWGGKPHLLLSGNLNLLNGHIEGAVIREFMNYDEMWGDANFPEVEIKKKTTKS